MARHGGYKIIDFGGVALNNSTAVKIPGIYEAIESTDKMTIASGIGVSSDNSTVMKDTPMTFLHSETDVIMGTGMVNAQFSQVKINSDDNVIVL